MSTHFPLTHVSSQKCGHFYCRCYCWCSSLLAFYCFIFNIFLCCMLEWTRLVIKLPPHKKCLSLSLALRLCFFLKGGIWNNFILEAWKNFTHRNTQCLCVDNKIFCEQAACECIRVRVWEQICHYLIRFDKAKRQWHSMRKSLRAKSMRYVECAHSHTNSFDLVFISDRFIYLFFGMRSFTRLFFFFFTPKMTRNISFSNTDDVVCVCVLFSAYALLRFESNAFVLLYY